MRPFTAADILLPDPQADLSAWAVLACDQFTSTPAYWQQVQAARKGKPSALDIILPECYLEKPDTPARIKAIHANMKEMAQKVLGRCVHGFVYVERTTQSGVRRGLVGAVDLEAYSYRAGAAPLVRPSEATVAARIPPRLAVRRGAVLESPHIMMLMDDAPLDILGSLAAEKAQLVKLYDTPLMLGGGRVAGWAVTEPEALEALEKAVENLAQPEEFRKKIPQRGHGAFCTGCRRRKPFACHGEGILGRAEAHPFPRGTANSPGAFLPGRGVQHFQPGPAGRAHPPGGVRHRAGRILPRVRGISARTGGACAAKRGPAVLRFGQRRQTRGHAARQQCRAPLGRGHAGGVPWRSVCTKGWRAGRLYSRRGYFARAVGARGRCGRAAAAL